MAEGRLQKGGDQMRSKKWNILVYLHASLLLWAMLFVNSLHIPDGGKTAGVLSVGNILFLLVNIPLAIFSFVLNAKGFFSKAYRGPIVVLSIMNAIIGIIAWLFIILLLQKP